MAPRGPGAGNGPDDHLAVLHAHQHLGGAAHDADIVKLQVVKVRRRVECPEIPIGEKWWRRGEVDAPREHRLEDVTGRDVLLDARDVGAKGVVGVGRRGAGHRHRLHGEGLHLAGRLEAAEPEVNARLGVVKALPQRCGIGTGRHFDGGNDGGAIVDVVEHQESVDHHEERVGQVAVVGRGIGQALERAHHVVAHEPDGTAGEAWQSRHMGGRMGAHDLAQMGEG